ncbi:hypothetical protein BGZ60DRAFT_450970 [Tricladium varicosporioides]|nr:hypothetical protein BGZ60DRAFT_450970 [Hymenoscyphus varicosporioides]
MDELIKAIHTTPIIDNHAHPLLTAAFQGKYPLLAITTEAHGDAMNTTKSSLSHIRAVNQLSSILSCPNNWESVVKAIEQEKLKPDAWMKRCFQGIETLLVDDGLDGKEEVYGYEWHDRLVRGKCKRIVRIEKVAEEFIEELLTEEGMTLQGAVPKFVQRFTASMKKAIRDPEVVGFKSVICYRAGLDVSDVSPEEFVREFKELFSMLKARGATTFKRIDRSIINCFLVNLTADIIQDSPGWKKPFQFHTGLGDNDITLTRSSPAHLQSFIRKYPTVPIVLLHASYPWTKEAGYLASVYENVYTDIGEVFPFLSQEGQENVVREILELCPTEKILWSTDGHWFPETFLLATLQVREALEIVLPEYVNKGVMSIPQAVRAVQDILFTTSNTLYNLSLPLVPLLTALPLNSSPAQRQSDLQVLTNFLTKNSDTRFLRLQYIDYTSTLRIRIIPLKRAQDLLKKGEHLSVGITTASLGLLQNDTLAPGMTGTGEYKLVGILSSLSPGPAKGYASMMCEFRNLDGSEVSLCPRTILRNAVQNAKSTQGLEFLLGFEIEIVFLSRPPLSENKGDTYILPPGSAGHAWNSSRALHSPSILLMLEEIYDKLFKAGIELEQFHPEGASGQYEFILPPHPPLQAVDMLVYAREIITSVAASYDLRATLHPKPFAFQPGTASHAHMSISSSGGDEKKCYESFYSGVLDSLCAILAFTYCNPVSYSRMLDGCWAGGRWVAWGTQNRETALRKIKDSHWEIKVIDGLTNMYFSIAAIITAGTHGVASKYQLAINDCAVDPATLDESERADLGVENMLPKDLPSALLELEEDEILQGLGKGVLERYVNVKRGELKLLEPMKVHEKWKWVIDRY